MPVITSLFGQLHHKGCITGGQQGRGDDFVIMRVVRLYYNFIFNIKSFSLDPGMQKDRHRGTGGAKEGFSSIGRFRKINIIGIFWSILKEILRY